MFCKYCGTRLPNGTKFCAKCGKPLTMPNTGTPVNNNYQPVTPQPSTVAPTGYPAPASKPSAPQGVHYTQPMGVQAAPVGQLKTNRGLIKFILLTMITFGIYAIVYYSSISNDINVMASRYDGKKTMHFCLLAFLVSPFTLGIATFVWFHKMSNRIGSELSRRGISYSFSATDFWLWDILGSLIFVGPFIYLHKLSVAMNQLSADYNVRG